MPFDVMEYFNTEDSKKTVDNLGLGAYLTEYTKTGKTFADLETFFVNKGLVEYVRDFQKLYQALESWSNPETPEETKKQKFNDCKTLLAKLSHVNKSTEPGKKNFLQAVEDYKQGNGFDDIGKPEVQLVFQMAQLTNVYADVFLTHQRTSNFTKVKNESPKSGDLYNEYDLIQKEIDTIVVDSFEYGENFIQNFAKNTEEYTKMVNDGTEMQTEDYINAKYNSKLEEANKEFDNPETTTSEAVKELAKVEAVYAAEFRAQLEKENNENKRLQQLKEDAERQIKERTEADDKFENDHIDKSIDLQNKQSDARKEIETVTKELEELNAKRDSLSREISEALYQQQDYEGNRLDFEQKPPQSHFDKLQMFEQIQYHAKNNIINKLAFYMDFDADPQNCLAKAAQMTESEFKSLQKQNIANEKALTKERQKLQKNNQPLASSSKYTELYNKYQESNRTVQLYEEFTTLKDGLGEYNEYFKPTFDKIGKLDKSINAFEFLKSEINERIEEDIANEKFPYQPYYRAAEKMSSLKQVDLEALENKKLESQNVSVTIADKEKKLAELKELSTKLDKDLDVENELYKAKSSEMEKRPELKVPEECSKLGVIFTDEQINEKVNTFIADKKAVINDQIAKDRLAMQNKLKENVSKECKEEGLKKVTFGTKKLEGMKTIETRMKQATEKLVAFNNKRDTAVANLSGAKDEPNIELYEGMAERLKYFKDNINQCKPSSHGDSPEFTNMSNEMIAAYNDINTFVNDLKAADGLAARKQIEQERIEAIKTRLSTLQANCHRYQEAKKGFHPFPSKMRHIRLNMSSSMENFSKTAVENLANDQKIKSMNVGVVESIRLVGENPVKTAEDGPKFFSDKITATYKDAQKKMEKIKSKDLEKEVNVAENNGKDLEKEEFQKPVMGGLK